MKTISGPRYPVDHGRNRLKTILGQPISSLRFHTIDDASSMCGESCNCSLKTEVGKITSLVITPRLIRVITWVITPSCGVLCNIAFNQFEKLQISSNELLPVQG